MTDGNNSTSGEAMREQGVFLLGLYRAGLGLPERELYRYFLDYAVKLTESKIGFFHLLEADQKTIKLTAWNQAVVRNCIIPKETHYPIEKAGNWIDCVRLKKPIMYNNYVNSPNQKGLPKGHVGIERMLSIPIIEDNEVFAIFGVGNKESDYENKDLQKLELVATELNKILKQRRIEAQLRQAKEQYQALFQNMNEGVAFCKLLYDENGVPDDFLYLETNKAFEHITKLTSVMGKKASETERRMKDDPELFCIYSRVAQSGKVEKHEVYSKPLDLWLSISVYSPLKGYFAAVLEDITSRKGAEQKLEEHNKQLEKLVEARTKQLHEKE
ncbi:MAG: GAF domain-containing protein [Candidatus Bathyarchaeota archaeon]|nr:GAF domain-containing protein [Candidatus Bathyarchaeota archaeon]